MKLTCIVLCSALILAGCYTEAPITRDELASCDDVVFFYLRDGACIKSGSGGYQQEEGGYQVKGEYVIGSVRTFVDTVQTADIKLSYVQNPDMISPDGSVSDDADVTFLLHDGSKITSDAGNHHWLGYAYVVKGERFAVGQAVGQEFDGFILDRQITEMTTERMDAVSTTIAVVTPIAVVALVVGAVFSGPFHLELGRNLR